MTNFPGSNGTVSNGTSKPSLHAHPIDVLGFLIGRRQSIQRLIYGQGNLWFAACLVATAALAREYDAVSLLHQPYDLLGPFAASLILATGLYLCLCVCLSLSNIKQRAWHRHYRALLCGYWMTAPLAWLYAIPVEAFASEITALRFNLTALSLVSLWRVALYSRVVAVHFRIPFWAALPWVTLPCMAVAFLGLLQSVMSLVPMMGGIRLTQTQQILVDFQSVVLGGIFYSAVPVLILGIVSMVICSQRGKRELPCRRLPRLHRQCWWIPACTLVAAFAGLFTFQPALHRAARVDRHLLAGEFEPAFRLMETNGEAAFPKQWDPVPTFPTSQESKPRIYQMIRSLAEQNPPGWIHNRLLVQAEDLLFRQAGWYQGTRRLRADLNGIIDLDLDSLISLRESMALLETVVSDPKRRDACRELLMILDRSIKWETSQQESANDSNDFASEQEDEADQEPKTTQIGEGTD